MYVFFFENFSMFFTKYNNSNKLKEWKGNAMKKNNVFVFNTLSISTIKAVEAFSNFYNLFFIS